LASLMQSDDQSQQAMRLDSLLIDARNAKANALSLDQAAKELQLLEAELKSAGIDAASWQARVGQACQQKSAETLLLLAEDGRAQLSEALRSKAARARRHAVLHGLAKLGYSVQEG